MGIKAIILKVSNICNLSCKYCYVYNKNDKTYQTEPDFMSLDIIENILIKIENYCKKNTIKNFFIVFHGGEPLLLGELFYKKFMDLAKQIIRSTKLHYSMQTNGTLLTNEFCLLLQQSNIQIGMSIDGNAIASKNRVFKNTNKEAFSAIMRGYNTLIKYQTANVLSVINTNTSVVDYYGFFKSLKPSYMDGLFPDATFDNQDINAKNIGLWLIELFDLWYFDKDQAKPHIRIFIDSINLFLGINNRIGGEMLGRGFNGVIDIRTNGDIDVVDTLKICNCTLLSKKYNIACNNIEDITEEDIFYKFYNAHQDSVLCNKCKKCVIKYICGGGLLTYRFSKNKNFDNPSIYCYDMFLLLSHIQNRLIDDMHHYKEAEINISKISLNDFI